MHFANGTFCHYLRRQLACKYCTFHTPKKLLARPVPSKSEVRDRRGLGILGSRQQRDAKQPANGLSLVDQKNDQIRVALCFANKCLTY